MKSVQADDASCIDLCAGPSLLDRFTADVGTSGLVGEQRNAQVILLAAASAKLQKPLNVSVGGASAAGKNHLLAAVARFIPDGDKRFLTGMTPKVLMHAGEDEYQHKAIFIAEYEGVAGADYAIRTMQSEQIIEWEFVESSNHGLVKKKKRVRGPAAFIQATTRHTLHPENETRLLFLQMDESEDQTRAINQRQATDSEKRVPVCPPDLFTGWHQLFAGLKREPVRILYASQLTEHLPSERIRSRRDFPKLLGLIEASAFLHQQQRTRDGEGNILADHQDYQIARALFEHCYFAGPDSKVGALLQAADRLAKAEFSVSDLIRETGWCKSKVYQVLVRAEELGSIAAAGTKGRYRLLPKQAEAPLSLPSKIRITAGDFPYFQRERGENFHISTETPPENFHAPAIPSTGEGGSFDGKVENGEPTTCKD